jgi:hypothetical protein
MPERPLVTDDDLQKYQEHGSHTNISYNTDLAAVVLRARNILPLRAAVTVGYGVRSNADYLLYHGFTMPREWSDLTLCTQYSMIELPLPADLPSWKSRWLAHPYRFAVPACPSRKSTPHVVVGAARFLVATEEDLVSFEERLSKDPQLLDGQATSRDAKFLHHAAAEALAVACDTSTQPPLCRMPLSVESERRAWALIKAQTLARVAQHVTTIDEDERLLADDEVSSRLTVNQRHAVIVRREEKVTLQRWCSVVVHTANFLATPESEEECLGSFKVPEEETLEHDEPRVRPRYWARLLLSFVDSEGVPEECRAR